MSESLKIYNTLSRKLEDFQPLTPGEVKMYLCGPTVYGFLHVGNFRGPIFFNVVRNWLEQLGYKVRFALNFTDVDDKILDRAQKENVAPLEISEKYIAEYKKDYASMELRPHDHNPKVTESMKSIIQLIGELVERGIAYVAADGEVLYSVRKFQEYGKLSHKNIDDLESGARVEVDTKKQDPLDFALWKPAKPGEISWDSPWCKGRPGWHIECSAMIRDLFGDSIDIHGGGADLVFPHHENEIAQTEGATQKPFVKYWMHNNMLTLGDKKMSKSLGNILSAREFMEKYPAEVLKFLMLSAHYRSLVEFSEKQVDNAIAGLARVYSGLHLAKGLLSAMESSGAAAGVANAATVQLVAEFKKKVTEAMNDDFNTALALGEVFSLVRVINQQYRRGQKLSPEQAASLKLKVDSIAWLGKIFSLFQKPPEGFLRQLDDFLLLRMNLQRPAVDAVVAERSEARTAKDFAKSDQLRDKLLEMGIAVLDTPQGSFWEVKK